MFPVKSLKHKLKVAVAEEETSSEAFQQLDCGLDSSDREKWLAQEKSAMTFRGDALKVYGPDWENGKPQLLVFHFKLSLYLQAPSNPKASLAKLQDTTSIKAHMSSWLPLGLKLEQEQCVLILLPVGCFDKTLQAKHFDPCKTSSEIPQTVIASQAA